MIAITAATTAATTLITTIITMVAAVLAAIKAAIPAALLPGFTNPLPFREVVRQNWRNTITQFVCMGTAYALYGLAHPVSPPLFAVFDGFMVTPAGLRLAIPLRKEFINTMAMGVIAFAPPAIIMGGIGGLWVLRDFNDSNAALMGLGYALSTSTLVVNIIKITVGGLRPHFWDVCQPFLIRHAPGSPITPPLYFRADQVCFNEDPCALKEAMSSFPSGHSSSAFAGFGFLGLWLFAHIKHRQGPVAHWKLLVWVAPWVLAGFLAWTKVLDGWHHPGDVAFGALLGTFFACVGYKSVYHSILNPATNHIAR